jgi:subtilisin family serine protease
MKFLYLLMTVLMISPAFAQTTYKVKRGERPPIDLQLVPENAYYKGVIKIKLNESFTRQMDASPARIDADGIVRMGISSIDNLNTQFGVDNFGLTFSSPAFSSKFAERHRAWGFHLWYNIYFDESQDVIALVQAYSALPEVSVAEPEYKKELVNQEKPILYTPEETTGRSVNWTPDDPRYNEQWHYHNTGQQNGTADADIDLPEAWEITKGNPEVIVCIEDGGINYTHNDIAANMWSGIGYNFVNNSPNVSSHDHGTHVAGTVAAVSNNTVGVAGVAGGTGTGDGVRLMSCQVFTNGGSGGFQNAPIWAADNGAAISQNSWGYTSPNYYEQSVLDAIDYFNVNGGGTALVGGGITIFAAGNSDSQSSYYPGYYSGCFSVAGLTNQDKKAWYSNYGTWIDVAAPGGETDNVAARGVLSTLPNNTYGFYQGTSMACPHVSGLAALIVSLAYGQFTPQQVADIIKNTTDNVDAVNPGYVGKLGTGRINAFAALTETQNQMINVANPQAFTALAGSNTQVNLNWIKNQEGNDVMVTYALDNIFGNPVQGQAYQTGNLIEGGGTIIYMGPESAYVHANLTSNTPYYYKAWSLSNVPEYSQGLTASATTLKDPITSFPYHESFDNIAFPPANWENKQLSGTGMWDRQTTGTNPDCQPQSGNGMARYNSHVFAAGNSGILVTPPVQFGADGYETSLWIYRDNDLPVKTDKVEIYINLSPNTGFASLLGTIHRSRELAPAEPESGWHQYTFEIPATFHNKLAYLVYKGISDLGNNLFVDDIRIEIPVNCFPPADLAVESFDAGSAAISWTGVEPATGWDVEFGPAGFVHGEGTLLQDITNEFALLTGLTPDTPYEAYVRGACDTDENSAWAGPLAFTTLACLPPTALAIAEVSSNSAMIIWTGVAPATAWDVEFGPAGFDPGNGTILSDINVESAEIEGLSANTAYEVYVRGACVTDAGSTWAGPVGFTTLCSATAPWDESFETMNSNFHCWQVLRNTAEDGGLNGNNLVSAAENTWFVCTPESFEGMGNDYIFNGERSAAILPDAQNFNWLISGDILIPETGKTDLSFWLNSKNDEAGTTLLHIVAYNNHNWTTLLSYDSPTGFSDPFDPVHVNLDRFAGNNIRVAFVYEESNGYALSIDNINIGEASNYWTGAENSTFTNPANWRVSVPESNDPVHIFSAENSPVINEEYYLLNVFIHPGARLTLGPQAKVEIDGAIFNEGEPEGFRLQANENSHAMLMYDGIGHAVIERYLPAANGKKGWLLFSSAVHEQPIVPAFFPEQYSENNNLLAWDEPTGTYINAYLTDNSWNPAFESSFITGKGYLASFSASGIRAFRGFPTHGYLGVEIPNTGGTGDGWHLLANPYPANYRWELATQNIGKIAKVWDSESASYSDLYPGGIIPALTGFWVQTQPGESLIFNFKGDQRTFDESDIPLPGTKYIILRVSGNEFNTKQSCVIRQRDFAIEEYDTYEDSRFLPGFAPQFYAIVGDEKLSTNSIPSITSGRMIPLGFVKNESGSFSLDIEFTEIYPGMVISLHDIKTGTIQNLSTNPVYNFTAAEGDDPDRFELFFGTVGLDENTPPADLTCYAIGKTIYLKSTMPMNGEVMISSLTGKQLIRAKATGENLLTIDGSRLATGTYLVSVIGESSILTKKVVLY